MPKRILVPMDGSPVSEGALRYALAECPDADLTVLHVISHTGAVGFAEVPETMRLGYEFADYETERLFAEATRLAAEHGRELTTAVASGQLRDAIVEYATQHDIDHIVMGSHARSGVRRLLRGSVAEMVIRRARTPVTVVPRPANDRGP